MLNQLPNELLAFGFGHSHDALSMRSQVEKLAAIGTRLYQLLVSRRFAGSLFGSRSLEEFGRT